MNRRLSSILFIAFVVASLTSYLVYRLVESRVHPDIAGKAQATSIVVAARDLEIGTLITDKDVTTAEWMGAPPKDTATSAQAVIGRGVVSEIYQGEPVLNTRLAAPGAGAGLAAMITPGMRAAAVRVDDVVGVAGFVLPGMHVDVLASGTMPGSSANQGPKVKTLLQNIEVLSAGTNIQKDGEGKPVQVQVVNLLVTPEQAELLSLASNQTRIQLVLRNPLDSDTPKTPSVAMASVLADAVPVQPRPVVAVKKPVVKEAPPPPPPAAKPPEPQLYLIQVYNGAKHSEEKFNGPQQ